MVVGPVSASAHAFLAFIIIGRVVLLIGTVNLASGVTFILRHVGWLGEQYSIVIPPLVMTG